EARDRLERDHGGKDTQAYQTQVLGLDGARVFSSFPIIPVATGEFIIVECTGDDVDTGVLLAELHSIPAVAGPFIIVGDMGRSPSPTEISVFRMSNGAWYQFVRLHMTITDGPQIANAVHQLNCSLVEPATIIMIDAHGQGTSPYDWLRKNAEWFVYGYADKVIDAEFNTNIEDDRKLVHATCKHVVRSTDVGWYCDACGCPILRREDLEPSKVQAKQWALSALKDCFSNGNRFLLGQPSRSDMPPVVISVQDESLIRCLEGTTEKETVQGQTQWEAPSRHLIDMLLVLALAMRKLGKIGKEGESVAWLEELGWSGGDKGQDMPWEVMAHGRR